MKLPNKIIVTLFTLFASNFVFANPVEAVKEATRAWAELTAELQKTSSPITQRRLYFGGPFLQLFATNHRKCVTILKLLVPMPAYSWAINAHVFLVILR